MDLNPNEVSRLLKYAAAMSAAQEKVTGSSRLDMAGIMAALAMARSRGEAGDTRVKGDIRVKTQAPQQSFLHTKFKQAEEVKPVHIPISVEKNEKKVIEKKEGNEKKEERGQVVRAEMVTVNDEEQMTSSWTSEKRSESARSSFSSAKSVFSSDDNNASVKSSLPPIKVGISNNNNNNVNNNYENVQVDSPKPALPPRNPIWTNKNNVDNAKDSVICNPKPSSVMNARSHSGILTKSSLDNMSKEMKVQERDSDDGNKKHQVPALKSSLGVAKFIRQANISGSEETVQQTKYQSENMAQHATKPVAEAKRIFENNAKSLKEEARLPRGGSQPSVDSEVLQGSPETMSKFLKIVEKLSETKEKETGNGRLEMTELMAALNHFQTSDSKDTLALTKSQVTPPLPMSAPPPPPPPLSSPPHSPSPRLTSPGGGRQGKEVTPHARSESLEQSGNTFLADNAKSSFLKSTLSHTTSVLEGNSTNKTQQNKTSSSLFSEEKSSLLGELKSRLNGETDFQEAETRSRQMTVTDPDQLVNKMVYNQYRGMLNSYRNNK